MEWNWSMQVDVVIALGVVTTVIGLLAFSRVDPDNYYAVRLREERLGSDHTGFLARKWHGRRRNERGWSSALS